MNIISHTSIDSKIIELRENFVIIDRDVAELYGVETKRVNEAVTNNPDKFPKDYMFELTKDEKKQGGRIFRPPPTYQIFTILTKGFY